MKKYNISSDINRLSEQEKYPNPIPSRETIIRYLKDVNVPVTIENIAKALELKNKKALVALSYRINAMLRDKQAKREDHFISLLNQNVSNIKGEVCFDANGRAFIRSHSQSAYLSMTDSKILFSGDMIAARVLGMNSENLIEAELQEIIKRKKKYVTGYYKKLFDSKVLLPINKNFFSPVVLIHPKNMQDGSMVQAKIISYPSHRSPTVAKPVTEKVFDLCKPKSLEQALMIVDEKYDLEPRCSSQALKQADLLPEDILPNDLINRSDFRHLSFVTIDSATTEDIDDAVYGEKTNNGYKLYVAIADVCHYVKMNSHIDINAELRSTSMYFPNKAYHMLPEKLAQGICSLKAHVDRLAMICEIEISKSGKLGAFQFYQGVIKSKMQMTYKQVRKVLDGQEELANKKIYASLSSLAEIHNLLKNRRKKKGAMLFNMQETTLVLDSEDRLADVLCEHRNVAHEIIEECMIAANRACAMHLSSTGLASVYRVHKAPNEEEMKELCKKVSALRISEKKLSYRDVIELSKDNSQIQMLILRHLNKAEYTPDNIGHFGISCDFYTHFTSPIRRYPDLIANRLLKESLGFGKTNNQYDYQKLKTICDYASSRSRIADKASWDVSSIVINTLLAYKETDVLLATITTVNDYGAYVFIYKYHTEGLVHVTDMADDYYKANAAETYLEGRKTNKRYCIGDKVLVQFIKIHPMTFKIYMRIIEKIA